MRKIRKRPTSPLNVAKARQSAPNGEIPQKSHFAHLARSMKLPKRPTSRSSEQTYGSRYRVALRSPCFVSTPALTMRPSLTLRLLPLAPTCSPMSLALAG